MSTEFKDYEFDTFAELAGKHGAEEARHRLERWPAELLQAVEEEYRRRIEAIQHGYPPQAIALPHGEPWYPGPLTDDRHWPALERFLRNNLEWPASRVDTVNSASSKVVHWTPSPKEGTWRGRGLVVGYVQSGKTTNFTAVIAKAADVGYNLVIVLSGIHNGLRKQTQERLDEQLCDLNPDCWVRLTNEDQDFQKQTMTLESLIADGPGHKAVLCVVKKNAAVLGKLRRWLDEARRRGGLANVRALVIDDEADQASVATTRINPLVRDILGSLPRCTFIGYTATPFANVLIDPSADDLYPRDFILNLPRPDGYFGPEVLFGRDEVEGRPGSEGHDMIRVVGDDEALVMRPRPRQAFDPEVEGEFERAVRWFWLATAARRSRGDDRHSTMLVHTTMKTAAHEAMRPPLLAYATEFARRLGADRHRLVGELRQQWDDEISRVPAADFGLSPVPFDDVLDRLPEVVASTRVILDNYRSADRLDYTGAPVTAIAVGGNTLSRGLTLEGLTVSYFVRAASAYDTLLQMGRWFGFRNGYEDLPRIWMTEELARWFRHLATVEYDLRLDIERYEHADYTPADVGPRIRTHPALMVTTKMGAARIASASYGGRRVQTRYFREHDADWLGTNLAAADELVGALGDLAPDPTVGDALLFRDVPADHVTTFLNHYCVHEDSPDLKPELVVDYIANQRKHGSLEQWSVAVMTGDDPGRTVDIGGRAVGLLSRSKLKGTGGERADIKTLMSKEHRVLDLPIGSAAARSESEYRLMEMRNEDPALRKQGLLLLYPIDPKSPPAPENLETRDALDADRTVIGLAMVFPGNADDAVRNSYVQVDTSCAAIEVSTEEEDAIDVDTEEADTATGAR